MKIRIWDRLVALLSALLMVVLMVVIVAEGFLGDSVLVYIQRVLVSGGPRAMVAKIVGLAVLMVLAVSLMSVALRKRARRSNVTQETDNGELSISVKAIEGLVQKCVETHGELELSALKLESQREGLVIDLRIALGSSVSIPLVVDALQKQVVQYITACTGLEVKSVRVHVDTAQANVGKSPFDLPDMLNHAAEKPTEKPEEKTPVHQRLFQAEETPVTMPMPAPANESKEEQQAEEHVAQAPAMLEEAERAAEESLSAAAAMEAAEEQLVEEGKAALEQVESEQEKAQMPEEAPAEAAPEAEDAEENEAEEPASAPVPQEVTVDAGA